MALLGVGVAPGAEAQVTVTTVSLFNQPFQGGSFSPNFTIPPGVLTLGLRDPHRRCTCGAATTVPRTEVCKYPQMLNSPGCETGAGPQLVTWGTSTMCSADAFGYKFQWTTSSSKHILFDGSGP
jgi:hypothetical protein